VKREVKIGLVVFLGLVLLGGLIFVSGGRLMREKGYILEVLLSDAKGLPPGAPIYISGVDSGYVKDVLLTEGGVKVLAFIKGDIKIPSDSQFFVQGGGLLGESSLQVRRGTSNKFIVPPGPVAGVAAPDVWSVLAEIEQNLNSLRSFLDGISGLVGDEEMEDLKKAMKELPYFLSDAREASKRLGDLADQGKAFLADSQKRVGTFFDNANDLVSNANVILKENKQDLREVVKSARDLTYRLSLIVRQLDEESPFASDIKNMMKNMSDAASAVEQFVNELDVTFFGEEKDEQTKGTLPKLLQDAKETQEVAQKALKTIQKVEVKGDVSLRGKTFGRGDDAYMDVSMTVGMKDKPAFLLFGVDDIGDGSDFSLSYGYRWHSLSLWGGLVRDDLGFGFRWGDPALSPLQLIGKWWDDGSGAWSLEGRVRLKDRYGLLFRHDELDDERRESVGVYYNF